MPATLHHVITVALSSDNCITCGARLWVWPMTGSIAARCRISRPFAVVTRHRQRKHCRFASSRSEEARTPLQSPVGASREGTKHYFFLDEVRMTVAGWRSMTVL